MANILFFQAILEAIKEGSKAYYTWQKSRDKKILEACKESAEKYIFVNEGYGDFKDLNEKEKKKLLIHFRKRFFAYN